MRSDYWDQCLVLQDEIQVRRCSPSTSTSSSTATSSVSSPSSSPSLASSSSASSSSSVVNVAKWDEALRRCIDVTRWTEDGRDAYDGEKNGPDADFVVDLDVYVFRCCSCFQFCCFYCCG